MIKTDSPLTIKKEIKLVSPYIKIPENIGFIDFDTIHINENFILVNIAYYIFEVTIEKFNIQIDTEQLSKFISIVSHYYNKNCFHNFQHAINVLQMTWFLLNESSLITKLNTNILLGLLIAALCHDIDHPGNTNTYEINSMSKIALFYNDISVLENHHCAVTFELIMKHELNKCFSYADFKEFRKTIINCILGTDMAKHNEMMNELTLFDMSKPEFSVDEQMFIAKVILHYADLSNIIKKFETSLTWSKQIILEYNTQALKEELEGLPVLSFMKSHDDISMCVNEINFIKTITQPMWKIISNKIHELEFINDKIETNLDNWEQMLNEYEKENSFDNI
jgi:hypothetical protein